MIQGELASLAVDSSLRFPHKKYDVVYKGLNFHYLVADKAGDADRIHFVFRGNSGFDEAYSKIREFMCALVFLNGGRVRFGGCMTTPAMDLAKFTGGLFEKKEIPIREAVGDLALVANIDDKVQSQLVQLYVEAVSNTNIYFRILFLWHSLVFPNRKDSSAVKYISRNVHKYEECFRCEIPNREKYGEYVKTEIRHSIAHIVRDSPEKFALSVGNFQQLQELELVASVLQFLAKSRICEDYGLSRKLADYDRCNARVLA